MTKENRFKARGIDQNNEFVYGFPVYSYPDELWYIMNPELDKMKNNGETLKNVFVEIIQEPDKLFGIKDKNGKMLCERDEFRLYDDEHSIHKLDSLEEWHYAINNWMAGIEPKDIEIISHTLNIKDNQ